MESEDRQMTREEEIALGREKYARARMLPHQPIPDYETDEEYLDLLGDSAALGYHRALAKLGEYAMRRSAWVEAYFWMWQARRAGAAYVGKTLCNLRRYWTDEGYPSQSSNVHDLFSLDQGSIARALISIDSKHDVFAAKEYLRDHHPEFLPETERPNEEGAL